MERQRKIYFFPKISLPCFYHTWCRDYHHWSYKTGGNIMADPDSTNKNINLCARYCGCSFCFDGFCTCCTGAERKCSSAIITFLVYRHHPRRKSPDSARGRRQTRDKIMKSAIIFIVVRLEGFEPSTPGFEDRCSIR